MDMWQWRKQWHKQCSSTIFPKDESPFNSNCMILQRYIQTIFQRCRAPLNHGFLAPNSNRHLFYKFWLIWKRRDIKPNRNVSHSRVQTSAEGHEQLSILIIVFLLQGCRSSPLGVTLLENFLSPYGCRNAIFPSSTLTPSVQSMNSHQYIVCVDRYLYVISMEIPIAQIILKK